MKVNENINQKNADKKRRQLEIDGKIGHTKFLALMSNIKTKLSR